MVIILLNICTIHHCKSVKFKKENVKNTHYDLQEPKERLKLMHRQSTAKLLLLHQDMNWP